jgi:hypothetical protein
VRPGGERLRTDRHALLIAELIAASVAAAKALDRPAKWNRKLSSDFASRLPPGRESMRLRAALLIASFGLAAFIASGLSASSNQSAKRQIVFLFDERVELPGLSVLDAEITRKLNFGSSDTIEIYRESMDLSRFESASYKTFLRDFLQAKYDGKKIDVVVGVMAPALDFLLEWGFPARKWFFAAWTERNLVTASCRRTFAACWSDGNLRRQ